MKNTVGQCIFKSWNVFFYSERSEAEGRAMEARRARRASALGNWVDGYEKKILKTPTDRRIDGPTDRRTTKSDTRHLRDSVNVLHFFFKIRIFKFCVKFNFMFILCFGKI